MIMVQNLGYMKKYKYIHKIFEHELYWKALKSCLCFVFNFLQAVTYLEAAWSFSLPLEILKCFLVLAGDSVKSTKFEIFKLFW